MKRNQFLATVLALMLLAATPVLAMAEDFGSSAVSTGETYTLEQMLTYAIQDEYMAQAEYEAIMAAYGANAPFANTIRAEAKHIELLQELFATYGFTLPENTAASRTTVPASLTEAYQAGVAAENANIAMYDAFLAQADLPQDVRDTFEALGDASKSHLAAFTRNAEKDGTGMRNGRDDADDNGKNGGGRGKAQANNAEDCPLGDDCRAGDAQRNNDCRGNCGGRNN